MRALTLLVLAALAGCATAPPLAERPTGKTVDVLLIRGMLGTTYSRGLDTLADKIEDRFPNLKVKVVAHNAQNLYKLAPKIIIGHSLGANKAIRVAQDMKTVDYKLSLLVLYDPVAFGDLPKELTIPWGIPLTEVLLSSDGRARSVTNNERGFPSLHNRNIYHTQTNYGHVEIVNVRKFHTAIIRKIGGVL